LVILCSFKEIFQFVFNIAEVSKYKKIKVVSYIIYIYGSMGNLDVNLDIALDNV